MDGQLALVINIALFSLALIVTGLNVFYFVNKSTHYGRSKLEIQEQRMEVEEKRKELDSEIYKRVMQDEIHAEHNGYICLYVDDADKSTFTDILKGFEIYAELNGYRVSLLYDASLPGKILFKFLILPGIFSIQPDRANSDLMRYIDIICSNEPFATAPDIPPESENFDKILKLKLRIEFLQKTATDLDDKLEQLRSILGKGSRQIQSAPYNISINNLIGGNMGDITKYNAINSQQVAQGTQIDISRNTATICLSDDRRSKIASLEELISALINSKDPTRVDGAIFELKRVKAELTEESTPDTNKINKWLGTAKIALQAVDLGENVVKLADKVFGLFSNGA